VVRHGDERQLRRPLELDAAAPGCGGSMARTGGGIAPRSMPSKASRIFAVSAALSKSPTATMNALFGT
jgi:hypothetical protein